MREKPTTEPTDPAVVAAMTRHFEEMMKDPEFLAEVAYCEARMKNYYLTGEDPFPDARPADEVLAEIRGYIQQRDLDRETAAAFSPTLLDAQHAQQAMKAQREATAALEGEL
jgi:hypothetical protein